MDKDILDTQAQERARAQIQKLEKHITYYKTQDWKKELRKAGFKREYVDRGEQLIQSFIDGMRDAVLALHSREFCDLSYKNYEGSSRREFCL